MTPNGFAGRWRGVPSGWARSDAEIALELRSHFQVILDQAAQARFDADVITWHAIEVQGRVEKTIRDAHRTRAQASAARARRGLRPPAGLP